MDKEQKKEKLERIVHYMNLADKIRNNYSMTIEGKTSGSHTEVRIHNTDRNVGTQVSERTVGVDEPFYETFIRCAERLLLRLEPKKE